MSDTGFDARLRRIAETRTGAVPPAASRPPVAHTPQPSIGWGGLLLICLFFGPLGMVMRIARELYIDLTAEAVHYFKLLAFVATTHLLLIGITVLAVVSYRERRSLFWIALVTWAGYGFGSALMALKNFG